MSMVWKTCCRRMLMNYLAINNSKDLIADIYIITVGTPIISKTKNQILSISKKQSQLLQANKVNDLVY